MEIQLYDINGSYDPKKVKTQEMCLALGHEERQEKITIGDKTFWADLELIPLLRALNEIGLETRSHCEGHETGVSWVAIKLDNVEGLTVRKDEVYNEVLIKWVNPNQKQESQNDTGS